MSQVNPTKTTGRLHKTREEEADRCLNHTEFSKGTQWLTAAMFLAVIFGIPVAQHVVEIRQNEAKRTRWTATSGQPEPSLLPQVYDVFKLLPKTDAIAQANGFWGYWSLIPSGESISAFETTLKENSILTKSLLSPTQGVMTGVLGVGNEKAFVCVNGWLFYRPDVEYLTNGPFLAPETLKLRSHGISAIQPNPIKAISDFNDQLKGRGIELIVVPVSTKPMIYPEMLTGQGESTSALENASFKPFVQKLSNLGIKVFDPTPTLLEQKRSTSRKQFLATDTHWTPNGMEEVARGLAKSIWMDSKLPQIDRPRYGEQEVSVSNLGDIAEMLKLPEDQTLYPKELVSLLKTNMPDGSPWRSDPKADVLLLGDSFSNIYSLEGMGWGSSAGFAERLSYLLDRPIDKIAINAGGAFSSRRALAQQLASGIDRLAGKHLVIYEFSMRDLAEGDWKMIHLAQPPKPVEEPHPTTPHVNTPAAVTSTGPTQPGVVKKPANATPVPAIVKPKPTTQGAKQPTPAPSTNQVGTKPPTTGSKQPVKPAPPEGLYVTGRIASRAVTPKPGSVPYKDCLIALQITDIKVSGETVKGPNIVVYVWGMKDNQLVDGAYSVGQILKFKLTPWANVEGKYGGLNRQELDSDDSLSWSAFWGEVGK